MGCDYYILKLLHIYYNDDTFLEVELNKIGRYYIFDEDSDEDANSDEFKKQFEDFIEYVLTPKLIPVVIYNNNSFCKLNFEIKYKTLVENELNKSNKTWSEINEIIKVEKRRER